MKPKVQTRRVRLISLRMLVAGAVLLSLPLRLFGQAGPAWWYNPALTISGTVPVINGNANDYSVLNQGGLKNLAFTAVNAINNALPTTGGTAATLNSLAASLSATSANTQDYAVVNLGQLKMVAQPFYDFLFSVGYTGPPLVSGTYPWITSGNPPVDYSWANIGEAKQLFSFDPTYSTDGTGIPASWVEEYFPGQTIYADAPVPWSGGMLTMLQAYQQGINPTDFYNGQIPVLTIVSGSGQTGPPGGFVPAPLVVSISDTSGNPLQGAPVTFIVTSGGGQLKKSETSLPAASLAVLTNANAQATVYFESPNVQTNTSQIAATAGSGSAPAQVTFSESTDNGSGVYSSPFAPSNGSVVVNADGSLDVSWQNNTDSPANIPITLRQPDGTWKTVATVPAGATSVHIPPQ